MSCQILHNNLIDTATLANDYFSSEAAGFPHENAYTGVRRSKVWRSAGLWEITAANNGLVFQETIAVPLTASVAVATYTTTASFLTAIKTALEVVGASTYTVTQDPTTGKIKIASDGAGGGGILNLLNTNVASTLAAVIGYDTGADLTGALTYTADLLRIHTAEWLKWDLGTPANPGAFVMIGERNEPIQLSPTAVIKLQGNETDVWTAPSFESTLTYDDRAIVAYEAGGLHTEPLRYWRLYIEDKANPNGYIQIGSLFLGPDFVLARGGAQFPFAHEHEDLTSVTYSESGISFSDVREKTQRFSLNFYPLTKADAEMMTQIYEEMGKGHPLWVLLDADTVFSTTASVWAKLVRFVDEPQIELTSPGVFRVQTRFREEL